MKTLFLKDVIHDGKSVNIRIRDGVFRSIGADLAPEADEEVFDGGGRLAVLPAFYNLHTHAAMSLMRGYADDLALFSWLSEWIWPLEARLTPEDVYAGTRLAILEMIRSGTVFFNDMYWYQKETVRAASEMGVRCWTGAMYLSGASPELEAKLDNQYLLENRASFPSRIRTGYAPHAIYTVCEKDLRAIAEKAAADGLSVQIHLAETKKEYDDCLAQHGMTPLAYIDSLGLLTPKTVLAHAVYLDDPDMALAAERGAVLVHNPCSNMKLASGRFRAEAALKASCRIALGTDGACSNNSLSMLDEMKSAALLAKVGTLDPELMDARTVFDMATKNGAEAAGLHAGVIEEGRLADCILVDLDAPPMVPCHNLISNMVYAADPSCIDSVICDGKFLMKHHHIDGEEEILADARRAVRRLVTK